MQVPAENQ
jgi:hypothetical protein